MAEQDALHLTRWSVTSGSNVQSRGIVVIEAGDHHWQATAQGNGAVDALLEAVDQALAEILDGHPRLVAYDVHALAEGPDAEGLVTVRVRPPESARGARAAGEYTGTARGTNIIAASIEAYIEALNAMLGEVHWADAPAEAGRGRGGRPATAHGRRAEIDPSAADDIPWFDQ